MILSVSLLFMAGATSFASTKKSTSTTTLSSDSAECKYQGNKTICSYIGNAKFNQKTMTLQADKITINQEKNKLEKIVASGKNSNYSSGVDSKQQISASADLITIDPNKNTMVLKNNGRLVIGKDKYSGPHITYKFKEK